MEPQREYTGLNGTKTELRATVALFWQLTPHECAPLPLLCLTFDRSYSNIVRTSLNPCCEQSLFAFPLTIIPPLINLSLPQSGPELSVWDLGSNATTPLLSKIACHRRAITGFDWSNHQEHVMATASFDSDSMVYLWDLRDPGVPTKFHSLRSPFGGASAVKWSRREENLIAASNGTQLLVWDVRKEAAPIAVIPADLKPLVDFDWSYRDDLQVLTCAPGSIKFWSLSNPRKPLGSIQTSCTRARFNPFSSSCVTLTGQADHSWDLWNLSDISSPYLVKDFGVDDLEGTLKSVGPLSKFNWRRVLVGSTFEYQLVTWGTKDQLFSMWRIGADELSACGVEPSKMNRSETAKRAEAYNFNNDSTASPSHSAFSRLVESGSSDSLYDQAAPSSGSETAPGSAGRLWETAGSIDSDSDAPLRSRTSSSSFNNDLTSPPGSFKFALTSSPSTTNNNSPTNPSALSTSGGSGAPGSFKRAATVSASAGAPGSSRGVLLARPVSFDVELEQIARHPMLGLTREKFDKAQRLVLFSLRRGKTHVEVRITFPTMYPHGAPPSFTVITNTSAASAVKTKEILVTTAEEYVSLNRNCLSPAFSQLMEFMSTLDSEVTEANSIETSTKDAEEALTRARRTSLSHSTPSGLHHAHTATLPLNHLSQPHTSPQPLTSPRNQMTANLNSEFTEYVVKPTDSLAAIALFFNMTVGELRKLNKIQHSVQMLPGQILLVKKLPPMQPQSPSHHHHSAANNSPTGATTRPKSGSTTARVTLTHSDSRSSSSSSTSQHGGPTTPPSAGAKKGHIPSKTTHGLITSHSEDDIDTVISGFSMLSPIAAPSAVPSRGMAIPGKGRGLGDDFSGSFAASPSVGSFLGSASPSGMKSRAKLAFEGLSPVVGGGMKEDISVLAMRCKLVDKASNPPRLIEGLVTATPTNFYFEPDLDQEAIKNGGSLHYSIYLEMKKIREALDLKSMNASLLQEEEGEGPAGYLQILTKERHSSSKILLFMSQTQAKAEEVSQAMTRWISAESEKRLVDGLGLDVAAPMTVATAAAAAAAPVSNSVSALADIPLRTSTRHAVGDIMGSSALRASQSGISIGGGAPGTPGASLRSSQMLLGTPSSRALTPTPGMLEGRGTLGATPNSRPGADAAKFLGKPPTRPAPIIPVFGGSSNASAAPTSSASGHSNGADNNRTTSPMKGIKVSSLPKPAPTEDPDDLPKLLGAGSLLQEDVVWAMRSHIPIRFKYHDWKMIFSTAMHGTSLLTFYKHLDSKSPTILVIKDTDGHIFGGFASQPWHVSKTFFGTGESFLFSVFPNFAVYTWTGADDFYCIGKRDFLAMGGGGASGRYGLWLDSELSAGTSEVCKTFLNRRLSLNEEFNCSLVEVYHLIEK